MYSTTDPGLPFGESESEIRGGYTCSIGKPICNPRTIENIIWSIQQPVITQYRQMLNEITPCIPYIYKTMYDTIRKKFPHISIDDAIELAILFNNESGKKVQEAYNTSLEIISRNK